MPPSLILGAETWPHCPYFFKIFYWHQSANLTYLTKTVKQSAAPPRSQTSHYVPSMLHSVVARFLSEASYPLVTSAWSHEKWLTDITHWSDRVVLFDATPKLHGARAGVRWSFFLFFYFGLMLLLEPFYFLCFNIFLWTKCTVQWEKS